MLSVPLSPLSSVRPPFCPLSVEWLATWMNVGLRTEWQKRHDVAACVYTHSVFAYSPLSTLMMTITTAVKQQRDTDEFHFGSFLRGAMISIDCCSVLWSFIWIYEPRNRADSVPANRSTLTSLQDQVPPFGIVHLPPLWTQQQTPRLLMCAFIYIVSEFTFLFNFTSLHLNILI